MGFCKSMAKVHHCCHLENSLFSVSVLRCGSNFFILEIPVFMVNANTVAAWFGFYEEGVMDALPSAHTSLGSPGSFGISGLS